MKDQTRRILRRTLLYGGFSLACSLLFSYLTFPWDVLRQRLEVELSEALRPTPPAVGTVEVAITKVSPSWLGGVVLERVMISKAEVGGDPPVAFLLPELRARLSLIPLLFGQRSVSFAAKLFGGSIDGELQNGKKLSAIKLAGKGLQLGDTHDFLALMGGLSGVDLASLDLAGQASLKADFNYKPGDLASLKGTLTADIEKGIIKGGKVGEYELPQVNLGKIELKMKADAGKVDIDKFAISGEDVEASTEEAFLTLNKNFVFSMPHGRLRLHVGPDLMQRVPFIGVGLNSLHAPDRDGYYTLPLGGTLKSPKLG
jgi:type II secretion system protein N